MKQIRRSKLAPVSRQRACSRMSNNTDLAAAVLCQLLVEAGVAVEIDDGVFQWVGSSREEATETFRAWEEAYPDRAAHYWELIEVLNRPSVLPES